jgi:hypothetical protein
LGLSASSLFLSLFLSTSILTLFLPPLPHPAQVCSGDKVLFYWGAEKLNMFMFDSRREYDQCSRKNLNFLKNYQTHTTFSTLGNNSGDRYYAFIPSEDGGKGSGCVVKLRVSWGNC